MDASLAVLQAKQLLQKLNQLQDDVQKFAVHAGTLNMASNELDSRLLLQEANGLLQKLGAARNDFRGADSKIDSLSRSLPATGPSRGGMSPAAQWVPQLRAASKQFGEAVVAAEKQLNQLYDTAITAMNRPNRTASAPENIFDILVNFSEALTRWIEHRKRLQQKP
jgi:uncharacterized protein YoxC